MADVQLTRSFVCEAIPTHARQCELCGQQFAAKNAGRTTKRFCSETCRARAEYHRKRISAEYVCVGCNVRFHPKAVNRTKFCSRQCSFNYKTSKSVLRKSAPQFRKCSGCTTGLIRVGRRDRYCSDRCRERKTAKTCKRCSKTFNSFERKFKHYCSEGCFEQAREARPKLAVSIEQRRRQRRLHRIKYGRSWRKRCRVLGLPYELVNSTVVFDRDAWRCQICGGKTIKDKRGTAHGMAPTLDHRIPLSRGGGHLYANVQCAHRRCNTLKGNSSHVGQIAMFDNPLKYIA